MAHRRTPTSLSGILAIDKPEGMTSHDVVDTVRRLTGERRVGHAGTLDPLATGLLLVCVGPATRLSEYLMAGTKVYEARVCFGRETTTDDREGETLRECELPSQIGDTALATEVLAGLIGEFEQLPPTYSAIKKEGVRAYKAARTGKALELEPRPVELLDAQLLAVGEDYWDVQLTVSKGFYIRSFARDLGRVLDSAAHLTALRRTASGNTSLETQPCVDLCTLAPTPCVPHDVGTTAPGRPLQTLPFIDPVTALGFPAIEISAIEAQNVKNGRPLTLPPTTPPSKLISIVHKDHFLALYETVGKSKLANPRVVIPGTIPRQ